MTYYDGDLYTVAKEAEVHVQAGETVYQKWTCEACGERVTASNPNAFTTMGKHDECPVDDGHITDLRVKGCNYMAVRVSQPEGFTYNGETQR
ncbi:MAG TPA: hypothetical protein VFI41_05195 [Gemmatimonadales bacterium]|nr:hypothetical protein [Gemmatimonadales bacterium]